MKSVFVTGTDTGAGKTVVTGLLGWYLAKNGFNVATQKWIQTGAASSCDVAEHHRIMGVAKNAAKEREVPYTFPQPVSPHLAADKNKAVIDCEKIIRDFRVLEKAHDFVIVEGTGGVLVPYNRKQIVADIAVRLDMPVIIAANNKLGAINHTLLTIEAVKSRRLKIIGVVFNEIDENVDAEVLDDNPKIVQTISGETVLGTLKQTQDIKELRKAFEPIGEKIYKVISVNKDYA